jgi:hypothetical protein
MGPEVVQGFGGLEDCEQEQRSKRFPVEQQVDGSQVIHGSRFFLIPES